jgi:hypothetical protein
MRKHKSVVAILLAVMMIFSLMPTMAFAAESNYKFSDDLSQVVQSDGTVVVRTVKVWDPTSGQIEVKADTSQVGDLPEVVKEMSFKYYDLNDSVFQVKGNDIAASYNGSIAVSDIVALKLKKPDYATATSGATTTKVVSLDKLKSYVGTSAWTCVVKLNGKTDTIEPKTDDQPVTVTMEQTWSTANNKLVTGNPSPANTKVNARSAQPTEAEFYFDTVPAVGESGNRIYEGNTGYVLYDGAEHEVVMKPLKGYDVTYTTFNKKTGKQDAAPNNKVVLKDVLEEAVEVHATVADTATKKNKKEYVLTVNVLAADAPTFAFDGNGDFVSNSVSAAYPNFSENYIYVVAEGETYDPAEFVEARYAKSECKVTQAANKAATKANKEELKNFFKDCYNITKTTRKAYPDFEFLTIEEKTSKEVDFKELKTKYATLMRNFGINELNSYRLAYMLDEDDTDAAVYFKKEAAPETKFDDINFTGVTKTVYSGKKAIKKGKLKKNQTFTVSAVADSGKEITYVGSSSDKKITIDSTGKVTVKKGLKKGTYTLKVTAKTTKGDGYYGAKATETYKIVVKKK